MDIDAKLLAELIETFSIELEERTQEITDHLIALEKEQEKGVDLDASHYDSILRATHIIKGSSQAVRLTQIAACAHAFETVFQLLRDRKIDFGESVSNAAFLALDEIKANIRLALSAESEKDFQDFDCRPKLWALSAESAHDRKQKTTGSGHKSTSKKRMSKNRVGSDIPESDPEPVTTPASPVSPARELEAPRVPKEIVQRDEVLKIGVSKIDQLSATIDDLIIARIATANHQQSLGNICDTLYGIKKIASSVRNNATDGQTRMESDFSDQLFNLANKISDVHGEITDLHERMRATSAQLNVLTDRVNVDLRLVRLVPAATLIRPLERTVRDVASQLGKKVNFLSTGGQIEIDRSVLDHLSDPLIHIIRNSIDHGIEDAEGRSAAGKPRAGQIDLTIRSLGSHIELIIEDDGHGIDADKIRAVALEKGIITPLQSEQMNEKAIIDLIFHAGFSSKSQVTNISGRGVGLDVVRECVRTLNGEVSVSSNLGKGCTFSISAPLTLATDRGIIVRAGNNCYAISTSSVSTVLDITPDDVKKLDNSDAILVDGEPARVISLSQQLSGEVVHDYREMKYIPIVVITNGWSKLGLMVDEIIDEQDIVIKPLCYPIVKSRFVCGGMVSSTGEVYMVLRAADFFTTELKKIGVVGTKLTIVDPVKQAGISILVVDDSITTRMLEKNILETHGYIVDLAIDGEHAWEKMQDVEYDLVISDVEMPKLDGFELTRRVKSSEKFQHIPVIIVTSLGNDADKEMGLEVGADAYIVKGQFETGVLLDTVAQFI